MPAILVPAVFSTVFINPDIYKIELIKRKKKETKELKGHLTLDLPSSIIIITTTTAIIIMMMTMMMIINPTRKTVMIETTIIK